MGVADRRRRRLRTRRSVVNEGDGACECYASSDGSLRGGGRILEWYPVAGLRRFRH